MMPENKTNGQDWRDALRMTYQNATHGGRHATTADA